MSLRIVEAVQDLRWRKRPVRAPEGYYWDLVKSSLPGSYGDVVLVEVGKEVDELGFYRKSPLSLDTLTYPKWWLAIRKPSDIRSATKKILAMREEYARKTAEFNAVRQGVRWEGRHD